MPSVLTLRKSVRRGVASIHSLTDIAADELRDALEAVTLTSLYDDLAEKVAPSVDTIARTDIDEIVETLSQLSEIVTGASVSLDHFGADVYEAMEDSDDYTLNLSKSDQTQFKNRLKSLLSTKSINLLGRARLVFIEHEHYLCNARILTDIRPIFGERVEEKPISATIVHTLKLSYHDAKDIREFFVALDGDGLDRLSDLIDRAKQKAASLKSTMIVGSSTDYLDM